MGTLRFILALLVAVSHIPGGYMPHNYGASAILAFYFISGWLMALTYKRFLARSQAPLRSFYLDRVLKLWPSYMVVFVATLLLVLATGVREISWIQAIFEVFIVPVVITKAFIWGSLNVIPPSWSLGVETWFYLAVPILAVLSYRAKVRLCYVLAGGHIISGCIGTPINELVDCPWPLQCAAPVSDYFGLDSPLFTSTAFLLGHIAYERITNPERTDAHLIVIWAMYSLTFTEIGSLTSIRQNLGSYEMFFAMSFLLPISLLVATRTLNRKSSAIDRFLGDLSYPLFLVHYLALYLIYAVFGETTLPIHMYWEFSANSTVYLNDKDAIFTALAAWSPARGIPVYFPPILAMGLTLSLILSYVLSKFQNQIADRMRYQVRGFESNRDALK